MSPIAFQLRLEEDLHEQLRQRASEEGLPMATLVKRLIRESLQVSAGTMQIACDTPVMSSAGVSEQVELSRRQVELLEELVSLQRNATPTGGIREGGQSQWNVDASNPFGDGPLPEAKPAVGVRDAAEGDCVPGARVWIRSRRVEGDVLEEGSRGVCYVQPLAPDGVAADHFHFSDLMIFEEVEADV